MSEIRIPRDRRRSERRTDEVRLADYAVPELRKSILSAALLLGVFVLFVYMVHEVVVAMIAGVVMGAYLIPFYRWMQRTVKHRRAAALLTIIVVTVPLLVILSYSWMEISDAAQYLERNRAVVAERLTAALHQLPLTQGLAVEDDLSRWVGAAAVSSAKIVDELRETIDIVMISVAIFLFTMFYILTDYQKIVAYIKGRVPGRYSELAEQVTGNAQAVVYGALYATFLTQLIKSTVVLAMNLFWDVPLGIVLAIASFFIGFFPIVGSWTVYAPVAIYLIVFRGDLVGGLAMLTIGFFGITLFMSMYLRPKIAAEKSQVLNFYWMFLALVTGVYTFGLVGIIIGPVLIGILKAVFDTVTSGVGPPRLETTPATSA